MEIFLRQVSNRFPDENVIMIMDKAAWHTTGKLPLPKNITLELSASIQLAAQSGGTSWKEVRQNYFSNRVFRDMNAVEDQLFEALSYMNEHSDSVRSFSAFNWIVTNLKIAN